MNSYDTRNKKKMLKNVSLAEWNKILKNVKENLVKSMLNKLEAILKMKI